MQTQETSPDALFLEVFAYHLIAGRILADAIAEGKAATLYRVNADDLLAAAILSAKELWGRMPPSETGRITQSVREKLLTEGVISRDIVELITALNQKVPQPPGEALQIEAICRGLSTGQLKRLLAHAKELEDENYQDDEPTAADPA